MLPLPSKDYVPRQLYEQGDPAFLRLCEMLDEFLADIQAEVLSESMLNDLSRSPAQVLDEIGYELAAPLTPGDSDRTKRQKVATAVQGHKQRGTWVEDAKPKIDAVTGASSKKWGGADEADWVLMGDGTLEGTYDGALGADGVDLNLGLDLIGDGTEYVVKGNVYIDVGTSGLSAAQVAQVVATLADVAPAYMRVFLGYMSGDTFITYAGGQIG